MENASKALIMAGSVLIALMIIGALLLMFNNLSSYQETNTKTTKEVQVIEFNNQYETYNRKNVRGSDLYSLLNRVVDYNRRKSSEGTGKNEGQYLAYAPMTITFDLSSGGGKEAFWASTESGDHLIEENSYTVNNTNNEFENRIYGRVTDLEGIYGADSLYNLVMASEKIFIDKNTSSEADQKKAVSSFNNACKSKSVSNLDQVFAVKEDVDLYSEYVQFKRARFDCITNSVIYNEQGRIINMEFKFTGKFE